MMIRYFKYSWKFLNKDWINENWDILWQEIDSSLVNWIFFIDTYKKWLLRQNQIFDQRDH